MKLILECNLAYFQNIEQHSELMGQTINSINGNTIAENDFVHNNMEPFFGSKMTGFNINSKSQINTIEPPEFHKNVQVQDFWMNVEKIKSLGFVPEYTLEEGLKNMCQ